MIHIQQYIIWLWLLYPLVSNFILQGGLCQIIAFMSILVILTPPCKTHLPTADHSAMPIGNSADPCGRIDSQDTGMHVQQTTKFTKYNMSTVMQLRSSWAVKKHGNLASTFQISIVRIFRQLFSSLYQGRSWARLVWCPYQYRTIADIRVCRFPSPPLPKGWVLSWFRQTFSFPEAQMHEMRGIDATLFMCASYVAVVSSVYQTRLNVIHSLCSLLYSPPGTHDLSYLISYSRAILWFEYIPQTHDPCQKGQCHYLWEPVRSLYQASDWLQERVMVADRTHNYPRLLFEMSWSRQLMTNALLLSRSHQWP